jgi:arginyl-tRNA synthetase
MNLLRLLQQVFHDALAGLVADPAPYLELLKPTQDPRYGDYQANCAMPLAKVLGRKPQEIAKEITQRLDVSGILEEPAIAGPGFINLRFRTPWLAAQVQKMARDARLGVERAAPPKTYVIDYSSPNVAKPMHVGHLRSTILGDALARLLRFLGHQVITDNHLGDWGTQFGILLYGYKRYRNEEALRKNAVREMARLYVLLRGLMKSDGAEEAEEIASPEKAPTGSEENRPAGTARSVQDAPGVQYQPGEHFIRLILPAGVLPPAGPRLPPSGAGVVTFAAPQQPAGTIQVQDGAFAYTISVSDVPRPQEDLISQKGDNAALKGLPISSEGAPTWTGALPGFSQLIRQDVHVAFTYKTGDPMTDRLAEDLTNPAVAEAARRETAKLHAGDPENLELWRKFMPWCLEEIEKIYQRLDVHFDFTYGESYYHSMLPEVVNDLVAKGIAQESNGAIVIFGSQEPPALIRKKDGAFTYTTTDLATIRYRVERWHPDAILYVVDPRQALHFKNLFEAARRWGYTEVALEHVSFGSVLGPDRKPIKTREGGAVELGTLLDEAIDRAAAVYEQLRQEAIDRGEEVPELSAEERRHLAEVIGLGAVKYADLSQNRTTDYVFNWDKMLAMDGNTATYMQYAYARIRSIFRKGEEEIESFRRQPPLPYLEQPQERALALQLLRLEEVLQSAAAEYKPNIMTAYLWDLAKSYSGFYQNCPVLKADTPMLRQSRLLLCDLTARVIQLGLQLLGIQTVERM